MAEADVSALLAALDDPSGAVRTAALRALVRLPVPRIRTSYGKITARLRELLTTPPVGDVFEEQTVGGIPFKEVIDAAVFSYSGNILNCLHDLLTSKDKEVRRATAHALSRARDRAAIPELIGELEDADKGRRADAAQFLSLQYIDEYEQDVQEKIRQEKDPRTRLWLAMALARTGDTSALEQLKNELDSGKIGMEEIDPGYELMFGIPEKLNPYGSFPEEVLEYLRKNWHCFGDLDFSFHSAPGEEVTPEEKGSAESMEKASRTAQDVREWYLHHKDMSLHSSDDLKSLRYLEPEKATLLISEIVGAWGEAGWLEKSNCCFNNEIGEIARNFSAPFIPDVGALFDSYLVAFRTCGTRKNFYWLWQIAWLISRADLADILSVVSPHLTASDEAERVAAARLIEDATRLRGLSYPLLFGGPSSIGDVPIFNHSARSKAKPPLAGGGLFPQPPSMPPDVISKIDKGLTADFKADADLLLCREDGAKASDTRGGAHAKPSVREQVKPSARVVNTRFTDKDSPDTPLNQTIPLKSDTGYYFCLDIGPWDIQSIENTPVEIEIPEEVKDACIVVAIFGFNKSLQINPDADNGELLVLKDGDVTVTRQPYERIESPPKSGFLKTRLFFPIRTPKEHGRHRLRCNIYYKQILLQSRLVEVLVADKPDSSRVFSSELDYTLTRSLHPAHFGQFSEYCMSIMMNSDDDGTHNFYLCASDGTVPIIGKLDISQDDFSSAIRTVRETLNTVSWGVKEEWNSDWDKIKPSRYLYADRKKDLERLKRDLCNMAYWGFNLYMLFKEEELRKFKTVLEKPGFIQLAMKNEPKYYFPAAFVYDKFVDINCGDLQLCSEFTRAFQNNEPLENTPCIKGTCTSAQDGGGRVVCPGRFWGFRHYVSMPLSVGDENVPASIPLRDTLNVIVAMSEEMDLYQTHLAALKTLTRSGSLLPPTWTYADNYDQLFSLMNSSPHVVYFYCHGGALRAGSPGQDPFLKLGSTAHPFEIHKSNFYGKLNVYQSPKPLIFMNGCHTAAIDPLKMINLVEPLLVHAHCAGVIGTEITIFEEMATEFAQECMRRFLMGEAIGPAIRNARLKVLSQGNPLGLAYIPFVNADLKLKKSQPA
jgi:hypothetical protein